MVPNSWSCFAIESLWVQYGGTDFDRETKRASGWVWAYWHRISHPKQTSKKMFSSTFWIYIYIIKTKSVILNLEVIYWPDCHSGFWFIFLPCFKILTFISFCSVLGGPLLQVTSWYDNDPRIIHLDAFLDINYCILWLQAVNPLDN